MARIFIMFYLFVLAALVSAAAISKDTSETVSTIEALSERSPLAHDYALVCAYERKATNFCQKYYAYGCDASGRLRKSVFDHDCDVLCSCVNLYPKPRCLIGITGASYCMRSLDQDETIQQTADVGEISHSTLTARSDYSSIVDASQTAVIPPMAPSPLPQDLPPHAESNYGATEYFSQHFTTADHSKTNHHRDTAGITAVDERQNRSCAAVKGCLDLQSSMHISDLTPKPNCIINLIEAAQCARDERSQPLLKAIELPNVSLYSSLTTVIRATTLSSVAQSSTI